VCTVELEAIIKSSENFPGDFEVIQRPNRHLHGKVKVNILKN